MRIYLAAAWARKLEIKAIANELDSLGYGIYVDSRWLDEPDATYGGTENRDAVRRERAEIDISDVEDADNNLLSQGIRHAHLNHTRAGG